MSAPLVEPTTRERLLLAAAALFRRQGLSGTGLKQVVAAAGVPWGSLYHFFPGGKAAFAAAVVRHSGARYARLLELAHARAGDSVGTTALMYDYSIAALEGSDFADGCPIGSVALDAASTSAPVAQACSDVFAEWEALSASHLRAAGVAAAQAAELAAFAVATFEGAVMLARTQRSVAPMRHARAVVTRVLQDAIG